MDILDNATIVKNLSDPESQGNVWSMAKGLIGMVDFTEELWDLTRKHHNGLLSLSDEDSFYNWCRLWDCFEKQWKEDLEYLNLDDLDFWLVNESNDIAELSFKLSKVKCRVGELWDLDKASQLHTDLLNIADRLKEIILNLRRNAFMCMYDLEGTESNAHYRAYWMVDKVCKWVRDIIKIQERVQKIIKGAESILNPQLDTSTEQEQTVKRSPILENTELIEIITESVKRGYAEKTNGGYYRWLRGNPLLAYFVQQLSEYLDLSEKLYEKEDGEIESTNWSYFGGIFETKRRGGTWELADGNKLHDYKRGAMKGKDRKKKYQPKGFEDIDDLMLDFR